MKRYFFTFLLLWSCLQYGVEAKAQSDILDQKVSISADNTSMTAVLEAVMQQTDAQFTYSSNVLPDEQKVTIKVSNKPLSSFLKQLLQGTQISYKTLGTKIILFKAAKAKEVKSAAPQRQNTKTQTQAKSSEKFTISGYIEDAKTGEQLIGTNIYETKTLAGTTTNVYGFYSLTLPADSISLAFSFIGYQTVVKKMKLNADVTLNITLSSSLELEVVEVVADQLERIEERTQMSAISLPIKQLKNLPALGGEVDVLRTLQLMPGVQSGNEGATGLYVRGGSPDQNLMLLDGVPIYNASHLFGFFSVFNADALNSIELIKGGFPARYGGRLSSVLDIRMKEGNMNEFKAQGSLGLIASKLTLEAPIIKNKMSFIVSGRRTYADLITRPISRKEKKNQGGDGITGYHFYDLNAKINYKFSDKDRLYLSFYGGEDKFKDTWESTYSYDNTTVTDDEEAKLGWGNKTGALRWNHLFSNKLFANTTLTFSQYKLNVGVEEFRKEEMTGQSPSETTTNYDYFSKVQDWGGKIDFDYMPNPNHYVKFGVNATHHHFQPGVTAFKETGTDSNIDTTSNGTSTKGWEYVAYVEDDFKMSKRLKANIGVHASAFSVNKKTYLSLQPRISARLLLSKGWSAKASFVTMTQYLHLLTNSGIGLPTDLWVSPTEKIKPQQSWQGALGIAHTFKEQFEVSVEGYYKKMDNLITYKEGSSFLATSESWENKVAVGKGSSYGAEVFIQKKRGQLTGWIGYTLAWSNRQFDELNQGKKYPYKYDRRNDLSIVMMYKVSDRIELSASWVYGTGNAITLPIAEFDVDDGAAYFPHITPRAVNYGEKNSFRMRAYHRLDLGMNIHKKTKWGEQYFNISVYNAYSRRNPFYITREYSVKQNKEVFKEVSLFPILPSVSYNFKF